jgi:hypothetical protein
MPDAKQLKKIVDLAEDQGLTYKEVSNVLKQHGVEDEKISSVLEGYGGGDEDNTTAHAEPRNPSQDNKEGTNEEDTKESEDAKESAEDVFAPETDKDKLSLQVNDVHLTGKEPTHDELVVQGLDDILDDEDEEDQEVDTGEFADFEAPSSTGDDGEDAFKSRFSKRPEENEKEGQNTKQRKDSAEVEENDTTPPEATQQGFNGGGAQDELSEDVELKPANTESGKKSPRENKDHSVELKKKELDRIESSPSDTSKKEEGGSEGLLSKAKKLFHRE